MAHDSILPSTRKSSTLGIRTRLRRVNDYNFDPCTKTIWTVVPHETAPAEYSFHLEFGVTVIVGVFKLSRLPAQSKLFELAGNLFH